jgi:hypothetical protein
VNESQAYPYTPLYDTICHAKRKIQNEKSHPVCQAVFGSSLSSSEVNIEISKCVSAAIRQTDKAPDLMSLRFAVLEPPMLQLRDFGYLI